MGESGNHPANSMIIGWWSEFMMVIGHLREPTKKNHARAIHFFGLLLSDRQRKVLKVGSNETLNLHRVEKMTKNNLKKGELAPEKVRNF